MRDWLLPPNLLTLARILLTPFVALSIGRNEYRLALPLIVVASATDALDGYLARRFRWSSALGEKLDPIADKLMLAATYAAFWYADVLPGWLAGLVLGRDALILLFAAIAFVLTDIRRLPPSLWGKISTVFQMTLAAGAVLAAASGLRPLPALFSLFLVPATALATVWSGIHYAWTGWRLVRKGSP